MRAWRDKTEMIKAGGIKIKWIKIKWIKIKWIKIKWIKIKGAIITTLLLTVLFSGCSSSINSNSDDPPQNPEQSRGEGREELGAESGAGQQPTSRGLINNEYSPGNGRLIVKLEILDNLISYESVSFVRVDMTPQGLIGQEVLSEEEYLSLLENTAPQDEVPQDIDASLSIDVALGVGDESARLDFGYVAFGRYLLNGTIYHSNGNALAYSELLIDVGLEGDPQTDSSQVGDTQTDLQVTEAPKDEADIPIEDIRPNTDATDPALAEYAATLVFDSSSALFRFATLPLVFTDDDNDGLLDVWHLAYLAAITGDLTGSYELTADLDLSSWGNWQPLGDDAQPFRGILIGNGHRISGISSQGYSSAGLFGVVEGASITDLIVEARHINASGGYFFNGYSSSGYLNETLNNTSFAGAVAGLARSSTFTNITVLMSSYDDESPYITAFSQDGVSHAGGLVGRASNSTIANTTIAASGIISVNSWGDNFYLESYAGGLAGLVDEGSRIMNITVTGEVDVLANGVSEASPGDRISGGLIGEIDESQISTARVMISGNIKTDNGEDLSSGGGMGSCASSSITDVNIVIVGNILADNFASGDTFSSGGAIGGISSCTITDIKVEIFGSIRTISDYYAYAFSGGLYGYIVDGSQISNIKVTVHGDVFSSGGECASGGIGGYQGSNVNMNNLSATIYGDIIAGEFIENDIIIACNGGGMLGESRGGVINSSSAIVKGDVLSYSNGDSAEAGGMVGRNTAPLEIMNSYALITGDLVATSFLASSYAGGFISSSYSRTGITKNNLLFNRDSIVRVGNSYVQILGNITLRSILPEDDAVSSGGNFIGRGRLSSFTNTYVFVGGTISAIHDSLPAIFGGSWGTIGGVAVDSYNITLTSSHYRGKRELSEDDFNSADAAGDEIAAARSDLQLRCPQAAGQNCGGAITPGNPQTYVGWDESIWNFGTQNDLPILR